MAKQRTLVRIPDVKDITIGHFTLTETSVDVRGRPSFGEWQGVLEFARRAHKAAGWWVADMLRYSETRPEWKDNLAAVCDAAHIRPETAKRLKYVGENVQKSRRRGDVDISLHSEVAPLTDKEQEYWLELAASEDWSVRDLRLQIRASQRRAVLEGQAVLEGMFRIIYADPPWLYGDRPPSGVGQVEHYPGMTIEDLCKLPIASHALKDSVLFMWVTAPVLLQSPGPREVGQAWGFEYKQCIAWDKVDHNYGHYTGGQLELLTIWTRGSCLPDLASDLPDSIQTIRKSHIHSEKPEDFRRLIKKHWTHGPNLELFGREPREDWTVFGNDARLWAADAQQQQVAIA